MLDYKDVISWLSEYKDGKINDAETIEFGIKDLIGTESIEELVKANDGTALARLACRYFSGRGIQKSEEEGRRLIEASVSEGKRTPDSVAISLLVQGYFHVRLWNFSNDDIKSTFLHAACDGSLIAEKYIRYRVQKGDSIYLTLLAAVEIKNGIFEKAIEHATLAASKGDGNAASILSAIYGDKENPFFDSSKERQWLKKAAECGDHPAVIKFAKNCLDGLDYESAICSLERLKDNLTSDALELLKNRLMPVRVLNNEQARRVYDLYLGSITTTKKYYEIKAEEQEMLLSAASKGSSTASNFLRKMVSAGFGHLFLCRLERALDQGEEWPRKILFDSYRRKMDETNFTYLRALFALRGIACGDDSIIPIFVQFMRSDEVKKIVFDEIDSSEYLKRIALNVLNQ